MSNYKSELLKVRELILEIEDLDDLEDVLVLLSNLKNKVTYSEWKSLHNELNEVEHSLEPYLSGIDDYDWEIMKESNPDLSDQ
ncbi:hypothetical protein PQ478_08565 [Alkalihalophilus pseudofirmus]|uniref:hypothetical protein n=1 Tax=Alkalihalophilus pseudofirmus TaxID=79885 RepID=UPI00259B53E9|nr:hypothetical protein [Alkalihalophilus pseudofirmus]WEG18521.1 hypothetical protein PQ478_08565 [Alkalihalophilus pseudofirmus]